MFQTHDPLGDFANLWVMRHHNQTRTFFMQLAEQIQHDIFVGFVQIAGRLIRQNQRRRIDKSTSDTHPLLFTAGKLAGQVLGSIFEPDPFQCLQCFFFIGHTVIVLGDHDVFNGVEVIDEVKLLENQTDLVTVKLRQLTAAVLGDVPPVKNHLSCGWFIHAANNVHHGTLARTGRSHNGDPLTLIDCQINMIESVKIAVDLRDVLQFQ